MAKIERFEDLKSWQKARELANLIYDFSEDGGFASEVQSQLYLALDRQYITEAQRQTAYKVATDVKRLINGLIGYLRK